MKLSRKYLSTENGKISNYLPTCCCFGWEKIDRQTDDRRKRFKENPDKANSFLLFYLSVVSQLSVLF